MNNKRRQGGDTIIEVLLAMVILSSVVTVCYSIMTRSFSQGQVALERTMTQAMLSGQSSMLRDAQARYERTENPAASSTWSAILGYVDTVNTPDQNGCSHTTSSQFFFDPEDTVSPNEPKVYPAATNLFQRQGSYPKYGDGMWIEGFKIASGTSGKVYYDFYIKACWETPYGGGEQSALTVVRLYGTK